MDKCRNVGTARRTVIGTLAVLAELSLVSAALAQQPAAPPPDPGTAITKFSADGGLGAVWEKNPDFDVRTNMALVAGEKLEHALTATATIRHAATALSKANELADGLYTFSVGLGARISEQLQLSVDFLDTLKNRPPTPETDKNDIALVTAITARF